MSLIVDIEQSMGSFDLAAQFESSGRLTALFGPSGSGKTTIVNLIGGLARPRRGLIRIDDHVLVDTRRDVWVPPHKRRIGYIFQDARLFPHLTVSRNLTYGQWFTPFSDRYADVDKIVAMLGIGALLDRQPAALSGGERQRVAIGRALLASPRLILMDEPLSSLDEARKQEILPYIERLRDETGIPIVFVSHSTAEVARLATNVVVLSHGKVVAAGSASEIIRRPDLLPIEEQGEGGTILNATVTSHDTFDAITRVSTVAGDLHISEIDAAAGTALRIRLRARDVMVSTQRPIGLSALNILPGTVSGLREITPAQVEIDIQCGEAIVTARITRYSANTLGLVVGKPVFAVIKTVSFERPAIAPRS